jgi:hypothetical protein
VTVETREQRQGVGGISHRAAAWLAWLLCGLSLALTALSLLLLLLNLAHPDTPIHPYWTVNTLLAVGFAPVGAVIVPRISPQKPIGWLFCVTGLLWGVMHLSAEYTIYTLLAVPGSLPAGEVAAWMMGWVWVPACGLIVFLLLLFPDGRLPSRRWRWFGWFSLLLIIVGVIYQAFAPRSVFYLRGIHNPLGVEGLPNVGEQVQTLVFTLIFVSAASLSVRRLRARGVERQQLKWFNYTSTLAISGVILTFTISEVIDAPWLKWVGYVVLVVGLIGIPISMGIAILRYRLYEIDTLINRTLVYGALTALLVLVYFGGVAMTQVIFRALTGQEEQPQLAIVVSTLVIAALFNPLRRRIQSFIDRRFYRSKYDAAKTLETFSAKLRDETDLDSLSDDLVGVVRETMQPAHVSLWLRPDPDKVTERTRSS